MTNKPSKELQALLDSANNLVSEQMENSYGELMGLYDACRWCVHEDADEDDVHNFIAEVEHTIHFNNDEYPLGTLPDAFAAYKASL